MKLSTFLVKAKTFTYAKGTDELLLEEGGKELVFEEGAFKYRDRYYGYNPFVGEEIIWQREVVVWSMNYYGTVHETAVPAKEVYAFLRKAMRNVSKERPFRGPEHFEEGDFSYRDESKGEVSFFKGVERIFYKKREVYVLEYHGGLIKPK